MIYLDNAATTKIDPIVLNEMMPYLTEYYGNAGSKYSIGFESKKAINNAREKVAEFFGAEYPEQIVFTSGGSESNNMIIRGVDHFIYKGIREKEIITDETEHDSVLNTVNYMKDRCSFNTIVLPVQRNGCLDASLLEGVINGGTSLVSVMLVNNEIGSINDAKKISEICNFYDVLYHTDCVQAAGSLKISVDDIGCDFASISGHKIHAPKGVGATYIRNRDLIHPLILGGKEQEFGMRGGTENVAGIVGLGKACEIINKHDWEDEIGLYETELKQLFWTHLYNELRGHGIENILKCNANSLVTHGKTLSIRLDGVDAETLILMLGAKGVCVSAGSACRSHSQDPSRVLKAIGLSDDEARETIRISFSRFNTRQEVSESASIIANVANVLRGMI